METTRIKSIQNLIVFETKKRRYIVWINHISYVSKLLPNSKIKMPSWWRLAKETTQQTLLTNFHQ